MYIFFQTVVGTEGMLSIRKILVKIFKPGLFLLAILLSILNVYERFYSSKTTTKTENVDLSEIEFPLQFSFLITPGFVEDNLKKVGYYKEGDYFMGVISKKDLFGKNDTNLGWAGNTSEERNTDSVSGISQTTEILFCRILIFRYI